MITHFALLGLAAGLGLATAGYAFGVEPGLRLIVKTHRLEPRGWPRGAALRIVALADPHMGEPYMALSRLEAIVERANALAGDLIVLLGDYEAEHRFVSRRLMFRGMRASKEIRS